METKKLLIWGGASVAALAVGYVVFNSLGSSQAPADPYGLGSTAQPIIYSSGAGTVPIDSASVDLGGNSSVANLTSLLDFQGRQLDANTAYQNRSLDIQSALGMKNLDYNAKINLANIDAANVGSLAAFASTLNSNIISGDKVMALTGSINASNGAGISYTAQQVNARSKFNAAIKSLTGGGISLANGDVVRG